MLQVQQQAAAANQLATQDLEQQRQDTWLVFVLVELLGSYLITPTWEAGRHGPAGACVDLLNHPVTYPQFVEVLLVCMALRWTAVLDDTGRGLLQGIALDDEMQVCSFLKEAISTMYCLLTNVHVA